MIYRTNSRSSYKSELAFLSIATALSVFGCMLVGYLALPLAAGFYAALLMVENKSSRVISYVLPVALAIINVFLNGFYSLEAISYFVVGLIIFLGFSRDKSKASTIFFATLAMVCLISLSLILFAFDNVGVFRFSAIGEFFVDLYKYLKVSTVKYLTSILTTDESGFTYRYFNTSEAVDMYNTLLLLSIPFIAVASLIIVCIAIYVFTARVRRISSARNKIKNWKLVTPPIVAYFYLAVMVLSSISSEGVFGISTLFLSAIFMVVYFYIGATSFYAYVSSRRGSFMALAVFAVCFFIFSSLFFKIISVIGVFLNNNTYKNQNPKEPTL